MPVFLSCLVAGEKAENQMRFCIQSHPPCFHPCVSLSEKDRGCGRRTGEQCDASLLGTMRGACRASVIPVTVIVAVL